MALFEGYERRMPQLQPVLDKYGFKDFEELYSILSYRALGYWGEEIAAASPRDMEQYYATEDIEKYGVVGIRIKLI